MAVTFTTSAGSAGGVQSSYALELTAALEGQFADIADNSVSTFVNETGAVVAYGNLVVVNASGSVGNSAKTIAAANNTVVGIVSPMWMRPLPTPTPALGQGRSSYERLEQRCCCCVLR